MLREKKFRRGLALFLALALAVPANLIAFADTEETVYVYADEETGNVKETVEGNVTIKDDTTAVDVDAFDGKTADVTVTGDVTLTNETEYAYNYDVSVYSGKDSTVNVTVEGDVKADTEGYVQGVNVNATGDANVTVAGAVDVDGTTNAYGVSVNSNTAEVYDKNGYTGEINDSERFGGHYVYDEETGEYVYVATYYNKTENYYYDSKGQKWTIEKNGDAVVTVGGDVSATTDKNLHSTSTGIYVSGQGDSAVVVGGDVSAQGVSAYGIRSDIYSEYASSDSLVSDRDITVKGDVSATGTIQGTTYGSSTYGVSVYGLQDTDIAIEGSVKSESNVEGAYGVSVGASDGGYITVDIEKGVSAESTSQYGYAYGVSASSSGQTEVDINGGGVTASGNGATGISAGSSGGTYEWKYDEKEKKYGYVFKEYDGETKVDVTGDVKATATKENYSATGVSVSGSGETEITVDGNVTATGSYATGVNATSTGEITRSYSEYSDGEYVRVELSEDVDGKTSTEITGDVKATGESDATGIRASGSGTTDVQVDGNVEVKSEGKIRTYTDNNGEEYSYNSTDYGIDAGAYEGGQVEVSVDGNVSVSSTENNTYGIFESGAGSPEVTVGGSVEAKSENGDAMGVLVSGSSGTTSVEATVSVGDGIVAASENGNVYGIQVNSSNEDNKIDVFVEDGGIVVNGGEESYAVGILTNSYEGDIFVDVTGDIVSNDAGIDVHSYAFNDKMEKLPDDFVINEDELVYESPVGSYKVYYNAEGDFNYNNNGQKWRAVSNEGSTTIHVDGDVTLTDSEKSAIYIEANEDKKADYKEYTGEYNEDELIYTGVYEDDEGNVVTYKKYYNAEGKFFYDSDGDMWANEAEIENKSEVEVKIEGNVNGGFAGAWIESNSETATVDLIVDGTISGEEHAIVLDTSTTLEGLTITVWQIEANDEGNLIERVSGYDNTVEEGEEAATYEAAKEAEKALQYIIRIAQPDIISTEGTTEYEGYQVANEGDVVYMKLNIPAGYYVTQAWQNEGQTISLLTDANGNYYLAVPRGGGVTLSVTLEAYPTETKKTQTTTRAAAAKTTLSDAEIANEIASILTKDGTSIEADIEVTTAADGSKTVTVTPAAEISEEGTVTLQMAMPQEMIQNLSDANVTTIVMTNSDGNAAVNLDMADVQAALAGKTDATLVVICEDQPEVAEDTVSKVSENYTILDGSVIVVKVLIREADGSETELKSAKFTLTLVTEYKEGMKILYVDENGNITETEAVWVEATADVPGHWQVPYMGNGSYLPVVEK